MTVESRDLPSSRLRRWTWLAVLLLATGIALWSSLGWSSRVREARAETERVQVGLFEHRVAADRVAAECGLESFSDEESLEHFPLTLPPFPTRREMECGKKVSVARSDLIEDHLALRELEKRIEEGAPVAKRRWVLTGILALLFAGSLVFLELIPRRS